MSRRDVTNPELEALDAALRGEGGGPELDELVALVRGERPEVGARFAEELDAWAAAGFPPRERRPAVSPPSPRTFTRLRGLVRRRATRAVLGAAAAVLF